MTNKDIVRYSLTVFMMLYVRFIHVECNIMTMILYIKLWLDEKTTDEASMAVASAVGRHRAEGLLVLRRAGGFKLHANILLYVTTRKRAPGLQVERVSESECRICERRTERE